MFSSIFAITALAVSVVIGILNFLTIRKHVKLLKARLIELQERREKLEELLNERKSH
jgi:hypothetical protein